MSFGDRPDPGQPHGFILDQQAAAQEPKKSICGELLHILKTYRAKPEDVERILREDQTRRRAAAVLTIFDTALKGRSLGSMTSPGLAAKVVAENRDAILEALR